jgi:glutamyl-tRNA reductase
LLQTCNRVEIHLVTSKISTYRIIDEVIKFWSQSTQVSKDTLLKVVEVYEGREALRHLLLLASGLESMVVGEDQILGQMRKAYLEAKEDGTTKSVFDVVFVKAVNVGRKVRVKTDINKGSVSVGSTAVDMAVNYLENPSSSKALVIGAGKTGELAANELSRRNFGSVFIANRTYQKSVDLAKKIGGHPIPFEEIYDYIPQVNLVISAVSVSKPFLTSKNVSKVLNNDNGSSNLLVVDLSQPRSVAEDVGSLSRVNVKTIDDLRETVKINLQKRFDESVKVRAIVAEQLDRLESLLKKMAAEPTITALCRKMEEIRRVELAKALRMINGIDETQQVIVENLTKELVEKILQLPIENLRNATLNGENNLLIAANDLFRLNLKQ